MKDFIKFLTNLYLGNAYLKPTLSEVCQIIHDKTFNINMELSTIQV